MEEPVHSSKPIQPEPVESWLDKRINIPKKGLAAALLAFKLFIVTLAVIVIVWHAMVPKPPPPPISFKGLPEEFVQWNWQGEVFAKTSYGWSFLFYSAACVLIFGGLIQLFYHSRSAGVWSLAFGAAALVFGIVLAVYFSVPPHEF